MKETLISVIMPARNASRFIRDAIDSVLEQTWTDWELIVVDNNSTDDTAKIARSYSDPRIKVVHEPRVGISAARNCGLKKLNGAYFCFLDSDDKFPPQSLAVRVKLLQSHPEIEFADGWVEYWNVDFSKISRTCKPSYRGVPFLEVAALNSSCLCAVSWMFRIVEGKRYSFDQDWTHSEDIAFFLAVGKSGIYDYVSQPTYQVRRGHTSTMSDLYGLEKGYHKLLDHVSEMADLPNGHIRRLRRKIRSIMTKTYLKKGMVRKAIAAWINFTRKH